MNPHLELPCSPGHVGKKILKSMLMEEAKVIKIHWLMVQRYSHFVYESGSFSFFMTSILVF